MSDYDYAGRAVAVGFTTGADVYSGYPFWNRQSRWFPGRLTGRTAVTPYTTMFRCGDEWGQPVIAFEVELEHGKTLVWHWQLRILSEDL